MVAGAQRSTTDVLVRALKEVSFEPDELAYLTLTSKPELPLRDRLAWALTKAGHRVAREWKRTDLAIMNGKGEPLALVELKAAHTCDVSWGGLTGTESDRASFAVRHRATTYLEAVLRADAAKMAVAAPGAEAFVLVAVTHLADPVPRGLDALVKYGRRLRIVADKRAAERMLTIANPRTLSYCFARAHRLILALLQGVSPFPPPNITLLPAASVVRSLVR